MRFYYSGHKLQSITTDSTEASKKVTSFYGWGTATVTDTTLRHDGSGATLASVRTIIYDVDGNPLSIGITTWTSTTTTIRELAELTWDNGNVVRLVTYDLTSGEKVVVRDMSIGHDDQKCLYMKDPNYLFTLPLKDLFWLSKNNPMVFNEGSGERRYTYWYNKFGYPSNFKTDNGVLFGTAYIKVR
jgi:hypothetical protein